MQKLVAAEKEPITPFISKVRTVCQIVFKRPGGNTRSTMRYPVLSVKKKIIEIFFQEVRLVLVQNQSLLWRKWQEK